MASFFIRMVKEKPLGMASAVIILLLILLALFGGEVSPYPYNEILFPASRRCQTVPSRVASACQPVMLVSASGERQRCRLSRFSRGVHR